jgi:PIN domain
MHYDVITFDTQTVETNSFNFDGGLLAQLKQFKDGPVRVIVSEVVVREIFKHLVEKTRSARDAATAAHKKAVDHGLASLDAPFLSETIDLRAVARTRLNKFLQEIGAEIIRADNVPMTDLVDAYFQPSPPFSAAGKNKAEFPDAIALLSLEKWAKQNSFRVLGVSNDKGWKAYAELHEWMELREQLSDALAVLQRHAEEARTNVQQLLYSIEHQTAPEFAKKFDLLLASALSSYDVQGDADSIYAVESDNVELDLVEFRFDGDEESYEFSVVQSGSHILAAELDLEVDVIAETTFYMSIYDSIDKDYTPAGSSAVRIEEKLNFKVLATFERDDVSADFGITKLEIVDGPSSINFGSVEPDYEPEPEEDYEMPDNPPHDRDDESPFGESLF